MRSIPSDHFHRQFFIVVATATAILPMLISSVDAQVPMVVNSPSYVSTVPQGGSYVCPKCGQVHHSTSRVGASTTTFATSPSVPQTATLRGGAGIQNVLSVLNRQRSRQGLSTLRYDATLQAVAERRAQLMASMGTKTHPPGSFSPGRFEGVGWSSSYSPNGVYACYTSDRSMTVAGAAMATGRDGVYFAVVYR